MGVADHSSEADKFDDEKAANGIEYTTTFSKTIVENLSHRLDNRTCEDNSWITHTEAENDVDDRVLG